jgi:hypothetical protein
VLDVASWILTVLIVLCGVTLISLVAFDVVVTVLHPEVESPLSTRFQLLLWKGLRGLQRILTPHKEGQESGRTVLNWGLPMMVSGLIVLWLTVLALGFALIYYPWIGDHSSFVSPHTTNKSFTKALYFSGVTLATLGYGDIQPLAWEFRLLAIAEGFTGAVGIGLQVAYVLAVYPSFSRLRTTGISLDAEVAGQASALPMLRRYMTAPGQWHPQLSSRLYTLAQDILSITEAHETHPVLYYAHPRRVQHSFLRVLATAQSLVALLRYGLSPDTHADMVRDPQLLLLEQALHYSLRRLNASLTISEAEEEIITKGRAHLEEEYNRLCDQLEALGLTSSRMKATTPVAVLVESALETNPDETAPTHQSFVSQGEVSTPGVNVTATTNSRPSITADSLSLLDPALDLQSASALDAFVVFHAETDPYLVAYANACGYTLEAATADQQTSWWVGAH